MTSSGEENGYFKEEVTVRSTHPGHQIPYLEFGIVSIPALGEPDDLTDSDDTDDEPWHEDPRTCACLLTPGGGCPEISVITRGHTERIDLAPWFEEDPRNLERWDFLDGERIGFSLALTGEGCGRLQFLRDDTPYGPEVEVPNARYLLGADFCGPGSETVTYNGECVRWEEGEARESRAASREPRAASREPRAVNVVACCVLYATCYSCYSYYIVAIFI